MISPSLESCEVKTIEVQYKKLLGEINDFVEEMLSDPCLSLEEAEARVLEASLCWRQKFLEMFISTSAAECGCEPVECPECEQACRPWCLRERRPTTLCGVIRVKRWVSRCASGHNHVPWDIKQKLRGQYTHGVSESMCRLASRLDFREASEALSYQGIDAVLAWRCLDKITLGMIIGIQTQKPHNLVQKLYTPINSGK